jgi:hypothetical protein
VLCWSISHGRAFEHCAALFTPLWNGTQWASTIRPLVLVYTAIAFIVTIIFKASVDAQGGAYATGVLVLMSSASFAVTLAVRHQRSKRGLLLFGFITLVFFYTTIVNIIERPEGIRIAAFFIGGIILTSLISWVWRSTEIRADAIEMDETAQQFLSEVAARQQCVRLIANRRTTGDEQEYLLKEKEVREDNHIPQNDSVLFLEIQISDASDFRETIDVHAVQVGKYRILRSQSAAVPNAIAAILLHIRNQTGKITPRLLWLGRR